jgi:hypothetical protein
MHLKDQFGQKLARDVLYCTMTMELFKGLKKMNTPGNLVDSPTHRYRESFFEYEYLREFEAKIGTARNVV